MALQVSLDPSAPRHVVVVPITEQVKRPEAPSSSPLELHWMELPIVVHVTRLNPGPLQ